jgi:hypothetical protein
MTTAYWKFQAGGGLLPLRRSTAGGARAALIGPDIGNNTISVNPDIVKHQE